MSFIADLISRVINRKINTDCLPHTDVQAEWKKFHQKDFPLQRKTVQFSQELLLTLYVTVLHICNLQQTQSLILCLLNSVNFYQFPP